MRCIKNVGETQKNENGIVIWDEPIKKVKPKMKQDFLKLCAMWPRCLCFELRATHGIGA